MALSTLHGNWLSHVRRISFGRVGVYRDDRFLVSGNALRLLRDNGPARPRLESHKYHAITGPGADVWESYVENRAPTAWRMWWIDGLGPDTIIVTIGPRP